jgi:hypothetical protein
MRWVPATRCCRRVVPDAFSGGALGTLEWAGGHHRGGARPGAPQPFGRTTAARSLTRRPLPAPLPWRSPRQVGDGVTEFTPAPAESRALITASYRVPRTLLVRFEEDSIDETPEMAALLAEALGGGGGGGGGGDDGDGAGSGVASGSREPRVSGSAAGAGTESAGAPGGNSGSIAWGSGEWSDTEGGAAAAAAGAGPGGLLPEVRELLLPGTHLTPCGADIDLLGGAPVLGVGAVGDALARARESSQADVRRLAREVAAFALAAAAEARQARTAPRRGSAGSGAGAGAAGAAVAAVRSAGAAAVGVAASS